MRLPFWPLLPAVLLAGCAPVEPFAQQVISPNEFCRTGELALINMWGTPSWRAALLHDMRRRGCFAYGVRPAVDVDVHVRVTPRPYRY